VYIICTQLCVVCGVILPELCSSCVNGHTFFFFLVVLNKCTRLCSLVCGELETVTCNIVILSHISSWFTFDASMMLQMKA
jgi:hypothetical protein